MRRTLPLLLVVAALTVLLWAGGPSPDGRPEPAPAEPPTAEVPPDERGPGAAAPDEKEAEEEPTWVAQIESALVEARARLAEGTPEARDEALAIYARILDELDPDLLEARAALDYTDFERDVLGRILEPGEDAIPESVAHRRDHACLQAVAEFRRKRWLKGDAEVECARDAVSAMQVHVARLENDRLYRLGEQARANVAMDPILGPYHAATRWSPPYLLCRSGRERSSDYDLGKLAWASRQRRIADVQGAHEVDLDAEVRLFGQLYREFLLRYGERHDLRPLEDPYGGRPDIGANRSFPDGVPLCVWTFENWEALRFHHYEITRQSVSPYLEAGAFHWRDGWIRQCDLSAGCRADQIRLHLRLAVHQLMYWFTRQRSKWRAPYVAQEFLGDGLAAYFGGADVADDGTLTFTGMNRYLVDAARGVRLPGETALEAYPLLPLRELVSFTRYEDPVEYGRKTWQIHHRTAFALYRQQSWMLVHFLLHAGDGKYVDRFHELLEAEFARERTMHGWRAVFTRIFDLPQDEPWTDLEAEYRAYVLDLLRGD